MPRAHENGTIISATTITKPTSGIWITPSSTAPLPALDGREPLAITEFAHVPTPSSGNDFFRVAWHAVPGSIYRLETTTDFLTWQPLNSQEYPAISETISIQVQIPAFAPGLGHKPALFLRVREVPWL